MLRSGGNHLKKKSPIRHIIGFWLCLLFFSTVTVVDGYAKLPNGDGWGSPTGTAGKLRNIVYKWIQNKIIETCDRNNNNCIMYNTRQQVVRLYGQIQNWDTSLVTNMDHVFYGYNLLSTFGSFNADISKWNMGFVTSMSNSKSSKRTTTKIRALLQLTVFSSYAVASL